VPRLKACPDAGFLQIRAQPNPHRLLSLEGWQCCDGREGRVGARSHPEASGFGIVPTTSWNPQIVVRWRRPVIFIWITSSTERSL
jgi:hypothetical protein